MNERYLLGTSFHQPCGEWAKEFKAIWLANTLDAMSRAPGRDRIDPVCLTTGVGGLAWQGSAVREITADGDVGTWSKVMYKENKHGFNGWSAAMMFLAALAYNSERDLIFKEQDCLAFGPWIEKLYAEIGGSGIIFGDYKTDWRGIPMPCAQSLFLVRHWFLPVLVSHFFNCSGQYSVDTLGEFRFAAMEKQYPFWVSRMSFGYDRWRPGPVEQINDEVFYIQQVTRDEVKALETAGKANWL